MPFLEIDSLKIHYEEQGEGSPVLLLHGWGCCISTMASITNALKGEHRVIALDFPGHGETPEPPEPWSVTEYCVMTVTFIEKVIGGPCSIIGHSFGGRVSIMLSATRPDLVKKLVLCDAAGLLPKRGIKYYFRVYRYKLYKRALKSKALYKLLTAFGIDVQKKVASAGSDDYKALSDSMKKTFVRVVNQNLRSYLKDIQAPTLLIWGEEDRDTPLYFAKILEKEIRDAGLIVYPGAGHYSFLDEMYKFNAAVSYFLREGTQNG